ncbi:MAG: hypothetical protein VKJ04_03030 [Vampirovibrionales bacterium]|nr:hypothetical protein [Vampirovibrionales bacterium]
MSNDIPARLPRPGEVYTGPFGGGAYGGYGGAYGGFPGVIPPIAPPAPSYSGNFIGPGFAPYSNGRGAYQTTTSPYLNTLLAQVETTTQNIQQVAAINNGQPPGYDPNLGYWNSMIAPVLNRASGIYNSALASVPPQGQGQGPAAGQPAGPQNAPLPDQPQAH